jgi:DNA segregation ATPase FtsK/SpoIIIE-like protein
MASSSENGGFPPGSVGARLNALLCAILGYAVLAASFAAAVSLLTWNIADPSFTHAASGPTRNALGPVGAIFSDLVMQLLGLAGVFAVLPPVFWALELIGRGRLDNGRTRLMLAPVAVVLVACATSALPKLAGWPLPYNMGGLIGDVALRTVTSILAMVRPERASVAAGLFALAGGIVALMASLGLSQRDLKVIFQKPRSLAVSGISLNWQLLVRAWRRLGEMSEPMRAPVRHEPILRAPADPYPRASMHFPVAEPVFGPTFPDRRDAGPAPLQQPMPRRELASQHSQMDEMDPDFERIVTICAPRPGIQPMGIEEQGLDPMPPAPQHHPMSAMPAAAHQADPIQEAQRVMRPAQRPVERRTAPVHSPAASHQHVCRERQRYSARGVPPADMSPQVACPPGAPGGDDLYGRAVAIVLGDRKASPDYLQHRLAIGYMRAADLIERMEREGILGAPVYNGMRPILIGGPGSREI